MHPSIDIYFSVAFFAALLGIVVAGILFFQNRQGSFSARLLAGYLFCFSVISLFSAAYHTDLFLRFPHVARSMVFLSLCTSPFAFLYVRSVLYQEYGFRKKDLLFFIPAVLYTINMVPFYLTPIDEKRVFIAKVLSDRSLIAREPEGMLPEGWGILLRMVFGLVLASIQFILVIKWRKRILQTAERVSQNIVILRWLFFFSVLISLSYVLLLVEYFFQVSRFVEIYRLITFTMSSSILLTCIYLLLRPNILYGMFGWLQPEPKNGVSGEQSDIEGSDARSKRQSLSLAQEKVIKTLLEDHFDLNLPFLKKGYRIGDLSAEIKIPIYQLSAFINQEYGRNFNDLVNEYRVNHLKILFEQKPEYRNYTLEALGGMVGFNSRTTFITSVKKISGMTPFEYFRHPSTRQS